MNNSPSLPLIRYVRHTAQRFPLQLWATLLILISGGIGFASMTWLLALPKSPQCSRMFWPIASASMRIHCAQLSAETKTVDGYLDAIELLAGLPKSHPLATEINRNIEGWATELLDLAENTFQAGDIEGAIAAAEKIPAQVQAYRLVEDRIEAWQEVWQKGEEIYAGVETDLRKSRWNSAFRNAVRLLNVDNRYWATTKYDDAIRNIQIAQQESSKLDVAYKILNRGGIDNWLKAMDEAGKIPKESYAYEEAQNLIAKATDKLTTSITKLIDQRDWQTLASVMNRLPSSRFPANDINDWQTLATAGTEAETGTLDGIEMAIMTIERLNDPAGPYSELSQALIKGWRREETALQQLAKARQTAESGNISDLNKAIAQAQLIPRDNPRYKDAARDIANWTKQVQISEDRPILSKARETANSSNTQDLAQAIKQAQQIQSGRALYSEARQNIREWQSMVQKQEDQPVLDQAIALGNAQNYPAAISTAKQISRDRALYSEARKYIGRWQTEVNAQRNLSRAQELAVNRSVDSLNQAIRLVKQVPTSSQAGAQRQQSINSWSNQLLSLAQEQATSGNYNEAIRIGRQVPSGSMSYSSAQDLIQQWRSRLAAQTAPARRSPANNTQNYRPAQPTTIDTIPPAPPAPAIEEEPSLQPDLPPLTPSNGNATDNF